jgi:MYXO-CTERM domain-containing protein
MRSRIATTLAAALLGLASASPARAQLASEPLVVPVPDGLAELAAGPLGAGAPGADVLLYTAGGAGSYQVPYRGLLAGGAPTRALDALAADLAAGRLYLTTPGGGADLVFVRAAGVAVSRASAPLVLEPVDLASGGEETLLVGRLLPRPEGVVVLPTGVGAGNPGALHLWDLSLPVPDEQEVPIPALVGRVSFHTEVHPLRLGATARADGVDDLAVPGAGAVVLAVQEPRAGSDVEGLRFTVVRAGDAVPQASATWLPPGVSQGDVLGAAAVDVDVDGLPDLVLSLNVWTTPALWRPGALLWIRNTGDVADFASAPWQNLGTRPELQPLADPATLRPVDLGAFRGAAMWDRGGDALVVLWTTPGSSALRAWRGPALGLAIREIAAADVVGSPLPDLLALGFDWISGDASLLVFADLGDPAPVLAWAPGSPGAARRGSDHDVVVLATDPEGPVALGWTVDGAPRPGVTGATLTLPGASLCGAGPVDVAVRGTDTGGQWRDLSGQVTIDVGAPDLAVAGGGPALLGLVPGGTSVSLQGSIWEGCGGDLTWTEGGTGIPAGGTWTVTPAGTDVSLRLDLPESTYAELLASPSGPTLTLSATGGGGGPRSDLASLPFELDAEGLVRLGVGADVTTLGEGELAVLAVRLESRITAPLGQVTLGLALAGLAPAGLARVNGAGRVGQAGNEIVLDGLPPSGQAVVVEIPVRGTGRGGAVSGEVRSAGGHLLTPPAAAPRTSGRLPGCGCGSGGPGGLLGLLGLLLAAGRRRPRRARARP